MKQLKLPVNELNAFDLPPVCVVTGESADGFQPVKFSWSPRALWLLIFVPYGGLLLVLIASLLMRKTVRGELPFSARGWEKHRRARIIGNLGLLWLVAGFVALFALFRSQRFELGLLAGLGGIFAAIASVMYAQNASVGVARIDPDHIVLRLPNVSAARAIEARVRYGDDDAAPAGSSCALHPETAASWTCTRCGGFLCEQCERRTRPGLPILCAGCWALRAERIQATGSR